MRVYIAALTRDLESTCAFESMDCQTGNKIAEYSVPLKLSKGERRFRTLKACKAWVASMNKDFGDGTAILKGKA